MAGKSESFDKRMESKREEFEQRKSEQRKRMDEHRESIEAYAEPLKPFNSLEVKVEIDVSDALKGLKAVQREAKKAAKALRETESISTEAAIKKLTDDEIFNELSIRGREIKQGSLYAGDDNSELHFANMTKNNN